MKKDVTLEAGISGVIPTGSFANLRPSFGISETIKDCDMTDEQMVERVKLLYEKTFSLLTNAEQKAIVERIERERGDMRFWIDPDSGEVLPSVTSVINYDADFFVSPEELRQYASQSQIVHAQIREYIASIGKDKEHPEKGIWYKPEDIEDIYTDIIILRKGNKKLPVESGDFLGFLEKYPIGKMSNGGHLVNKEDRYHGTPDFDGTPIGWKKIKGFEGVEEILTMFDAKRTLYAESAGMQLAAYCKMRGIKQACAVAINDKTKQGYSVPHVYSEDELAKHYTLFLAKRKEFRKRYGV